MSKAQSMKTVTKPKDTYVPLSAVESWYDFYIEVSSKDELRNMATSEWKLRSQDETSKLKVGHLTGITNNTSSILTIIAALEAAFPNLGSKTSLTLHLIGARTIEFNAMYCMEELLHLLPALKTLELVLIGPDIHPQVTFYSGMEIKQKLHHDCSSCTSKNRTMTFTLWKETYERYIERPEYSKPDLATAFHAGVSDSVLFRQWYPTIQHLVKAPHPTVFTCYCMAELKMETHNMGGPWGAKFLQTGEVNKWKTLWPRLHAPHGQLNVGMAEYSQRISYHNYYWYIIRGST
jgi:splicing suppressor protein 51